MFTHVQDTMSLLDSPNAAGEDVRAAFEDTPAVVDVTTFEGPEGTTDFVTVRLPGTEDDAPTLGVVGRLGGVGARPGKVGMVSDADGAIVALATAGKLAEMAERGERLPGDVILSTHVCPDAPTIEHDPVPFMSSPVDIETMNEHEVSEEMDAVLTIDATKGNRVHCERGFAITPTVKQGWVLRPSEDLLDIQERVTGESPSTLTLTTQDITPYGNDVHHINSILQPSTATDAPVVGSATGANYISDIDAASRFVLETAKDFTNGWATVYDEDEFAHLNELYGSMAHLQTLGGDR